MKVKNVLIAVAAIFALGFTMHRGFTQSALVNPPTVVGPGVLPQPGEAPDPRTLSYYGGYFGGYEPASFYSRAASVYNVTFGPEDIPQTSSKVTTKMNSSSVSLSWEGEPRAIKSITFALTDKGNNVISKQVITTLPVKATLKRTTKTTGYTVNVLYINGMSNTIVSPL